MGFFYRCGVAYGVLQLYAHAVQNALVSVGVEVGLLGRKAVAKNLLKLLQIALVQQLAETFKLLGDRGPVAIWWQECGAHHQTQMYRVFKPIAQC